MSAVFLAVQLSNILSFMPPMYISDLKHHQFGLYFYLVLDVIYDCDKSNCFNLYLHFSTVIKQSGFESQVAFLRVKGTGVKIFASSKRHWLKRYFPWHTFHCQVSIFLAWSILHITLQMLESTLIWHRNTLFSILLTFWLLPLLQSLPANEVIHVCRGHNNTVSLWFNPQERKLMVVLFQWSLRTDIRRWWAFSGGQTTLGAEDSRIWCGQRTKVHPSRKLRYQSPIN